MKDFEIFKDFHILASRMLLMVPFSGILAIWVGLEGVENKTFLKLMKNSENITFVPGYFKFQTYIFRQNHLLKKY